MSTVERLGLSRLIEDHGRKFLRYCGVSVVNVITGNGTLLLCLEVFDLHRVLAVLIAWSVSTVPAYLLSRRWVWQQTGANSMRNEVAPFWVLALIGLGFSGLCVWVAGFFTDSSLMLLLVNLGAFGVVWVAKYLLLERLMWGIRLDVEVETV
ncbi:MAG: GtrA family protein [Acidimicrobiales bacterium]